MYIQPTRQNERTIRLVRQDRRHERGHCRLERPALPLHCLDRRPRRHQSANHAPMVHSLCHHEARTEEEEGEEGRQEGRKATCSAIDGRRVVAWACLSRITNYRSMPRSTGLRSGGDPRTSKTSIPLLAWGRQLVGWGQLSWTHTNEQKGTLDVCINPCVHFWGFG